MLKRSVFSVAGLFSFLMFLSIGCSSPSESFSDSEGLGLQLENENEKLFHDELLKIAQEYKGFGRVDDETHWAPYLCRMPMPSIAKFSNSDDADSHGQKLYFLYANDRSAYISNESKIGQTVVKESWHPEEVDDLPWPVSVWDETYRKLVVKNPLVFTDSKNTEGEVEYRGLGSGSHFPYANKDGKVFHAKEVTGLYIMYKMDPDTPNTDDGWVYGTTTADGKTVTSAGRVSSCMKCHQSAEHDRLFGMQAVD